MKLFRFYESTAANSGETERHGTNSNSVGSARGSSYFWTMASTAVNEARSPTPHSNQKARASTWLSESAYPYWNQNGFDEDRNRFHEALSSEGKPTELPVRAMVQSRQIYSFRLAEKSGALDASTARDRVLRATESLLRDFGLQNGGFCHSISTDGMKLNLSTELYTQAFVLFALANAYSLLGDPLYRERAENLVAFLKTQQANPNGGYREVKNGTTLYQSNPHMHLFEAAIAWTEADPKNTLWRTLADEVASLLEKKFIDPTTGALTEHFSEDWSPERRDGKFIFEPGHHFEWIWLLGNYQRITETRRFDPIRHRLYEIANRYGVRADRAAAVDEVWSDFEMKSLSSRFWPQTERIKAAVQLFQESQDREARAGFAADADQAVETLFRYLDRPAKGLWMDTWAADGTFSGDPVKSSSLYHIAGGLAEYVRFRGET